MEGFELKEEFDAYLDLVGYDLDAMPEDQLRELKRAFFGGLGRMHRLFEEAGKIPDEKEAAKVLFDMEDQITIFWMDESINGFGI